MNQITKEALLFLEEAKTVFKKNADLTTYRDEKENFIALRGGMFEDCINVYELGAPVGNFVEQLPRQNNKLVDYDEYKQLQEAAKKLEAFKDMNQQLISMDNVDKVQWDCRAILKLLSN